MLTAIDQHPLQFIVLILIFLLGVIVSRPPAGPASPVRVGDSGPGYQYEFTFPEDDGRDAPYQSPSGPLWRQTPCGRVTHIRAWSDLH